MKLDPTYEKKRIESNGVWHIAFILSEMFNDGAPLGWSAYIPLAEKVALDARMMKR